MDNSDRISELPEPVLLHLLCFLPQKDAVKTCVLSKSWRHLGPTRPKIELRQSFFGRAKKHKNLFLVLENTLQRYVDQKLPIQEFILETSSLHPDFESILVSLNKWMPRVVMGVKKFTLRAADFTVPLVVFQAEFLEELSLYECKINNFINVKLQMLKRLVLSEVQIEDEAFEKIMSKCPLIEYLQVWRCPKLSTIKVDNARNLKHFVCKLFDSLGSIGFNDDVSSLETIFIARCKNWYSNYYFFPRLKSLYLRRVHLPTQDLLNNLNCPCLETLQLYDCSGLAEFKLSNRSVKRLIISISVSHPIEVISIDAANMIYFECRLSCFVPFIISFEATTTSSSGECKSCIHVRRSSNADDFSSTWSLELYEFLKALGQKSQISLDISYFPPNQAGTYDHSSSCEPVVIEQLCLRSSSELGVFNRVFLICRPRYVRPTLSATFESCMWKALVRKGKKLQYKNWKQDLEKPCIQVLDEKTKEWRPGQACEFQNNQSIRFWLKWKNLSI